MDIQQLRQFSAIVQHGSIKSAAESFYISRPAISKSLARLESELGFPLFTRSAVGVELTDAGRRLLPLAEAAIAAFDRLEREATRISGEQNPLHIGFTYGTQPFFDDALIRFEAAHPGLRIEAAAIRSDEIAACLHSERFDLCCGDCVIDDKEIVQRPVLLDRILYAVPPESEMARRGFVTERELQSHRIMGPDSGRHSTFVHETAQGELHREGLASDYYASDDMFFLFSRVKQGLGILGMPQRLARNYTLNDVVFVPMESNRYWEIRVYYRLANLSRPAALLLDEVFAELKPDRQQAGEDPAR